MYKVPHFSKLAMLTAETMALKGWEHTQDPEMRRAYSFTFQNEVYSGSFINKEFADVLGFKVEETMSLKNNRKATLFYYYDGKGLYDKILKLAIMTYGRP